MQFKFLKHTADVKFQSFGKTLEEAFKNSALATAKIIIEDKIKENKKIQVKIKGADLESLLQRFLEEILFLFETKKFLLAKINKIKIDKKKFTLEAEFVGDDIKDYKVQRHIKAVTYNEMFIKKIKSQFVCQVVVDI